MEYYTFSISGNILIRGGVPRTPVSCKILCDQSKSESFWRKYLPPLNITIKSISLRYFGCYDFDLGNNEDASGLEAGFEMIICPSGMKTNLA